MNMFFGDFHPYYRNSWALVIGINTYQNISPLTYAKNDSDSIASILTSELGFLKEHVTVLQDKDATREAIFQVYLDHVHIAGSPDDRLLVFFAGHGVTLTGYQGYVGYLVPVDGHPARPASLIRWDDLTRNADLIPAKHILFILDACFSGLALKRAVYPGVQRFLSEMLQRRSRQVITAWKADEVVADGGGPEGRNSIFTGHLLQGLRGDAASKSGVLTAMGLMHYVYEKLANDAKSQQTPHYGYIDGDGDFVFVGPSEDLLSRPDKDHIVEAIPEPTTTSPQAPNYTIQAKLSFGETNGYASPSHPSFGRNIYSDKLGTFEFNGQREETKAFSWLAVVLEPAASQEININIASAAELETLPGIGEVRASQIMQSRTEDGPFAAIDDLLTRNVISESVFAEIAPLITVTQ